MAEENETPEPTEKSESEAGAEQGGGEQPTGKEQPAGAEEPVSAEQPKDVQEGQAAEEVSKDARMWAMLCHLLAIFTWFVGPLIVWLIKKDVDPFINSQGKEALNFQITLGIGYVAFTILFCLAFLIPVVWVVGLIFCIMGTVKANKGIAYRYPVSIRFIK